MKKSGRLVFTIAFSISLFLAALLLVEGFFRIAGIPYKVEFIPDENAFARFDPELGWSYLPDKSTFLRAGNIEKPVYFDSNGIRLPDPGFRFEKSRPSVLFIGGSFTMGHGLSYEESFAGRFGALEGEPFQVVNLGVQGYGSDQSVLALKRFLPRFNARIVVYTFIEDHIRRNGNYDRRTLVPTARFLGTKPLFALDNEGRLFPAKKPLLYREYTHSYLIDFLKMRLGAIAGTFPPYPENLTRAIIQEMNDYSNEHGAYFVVLNWRWSENDYDALFKDMDIDLIDTMEGAPEGWEKMVLLGGIHPDAEAGKHAARQLLEHFRQKGLLQ